MKIIRVMFLTVLLAVQGLAWGGMKEGVAAYEQGDYATALREWRPFAEQGDAHAQHNLGFMYFKGWGVTQDYKEAAKWFRKAAEQGEAISQGLLGSMYEGGNGVPQDYVQAHMWYSIAGANGAKLGTSKRDIVAAKMTPAQIAEAQKLSREWMAKHP